MWFAEKMLVPSSGSAPFPNRDLPEDVQRDYGEARDIIDKSPRGAAALLRLAIQKLCADLGEPGKNINDDIGNLVSKGLPVQIQQALDIVRVIGNNAVHPGQIDLSDDASTANQLFTLVNLIADVMITQPKSVQAMYEALPESTRAGIERRDRKRS
jgi:hypothetical protein